jgi:hypothetical protein
MIIVMDMHFSKRSAHANNCANRYSRTHGRVIDTNSLCDEPGLQFKWAGVRKKIRVSRAPPGKRGRAIADWGNRYTPELIKLGYVAKRLIVRSYDRLYP